MDPATPSGHFSILHITDHHCSANSKFKFTRAYCWVYLYWDVSIIIIIVIVQCNQVQPRSSFHATHGHGPTAPKTHRNRLQSVCLPPFSCLQNRTMGEWNTSKMFVGNLHFLSFFQEKEIGNFTNAMCFQNFPDSIARWHEKQVNHNKRTFACQRTTVGSRRILLQHRPEQMPQHLKCQ